MAFLKLEDFSGAIDVTLFPKVFYQAVNLALPDEIVVVTGRVDNSNDTIQILAEIVVGVRDYVPDFWLTIPAQLDNPATLDKLEKIFVDNAGDCRTFFNRGGKWQRISKKISNDKNLRGELRNLLGAANIKIY